MSCCKLSHDNEKQVCTAFPNFRDEIVSAIKKILVSNNDRKNMGKNGLNYVKKAFN
jgi:hypothetical protein